MGMVRFEFLGTGNAFLPQGRFHSLLLIDEQILVDAPPGAVSPIIGLVTLVVFFTSIRENN